MKVAIVGSCGHCQYAQMFTKEGWEVVTSVQDADLVQFTGGEDVSPELYGAERHHTTHNNPTRDAFEKAVFDKCIELGKPMAGICRGGQFLNVMSGGSMWQDVDGHATHKGHYMLDIHSFEVVHVTSTHHQMMRPSAEGKVFGVASESTYRENVHSIKDPFTDDVEVVYYKGTNCLCFQPHPEFNGADSTRAYYFELIERVFGMRA